jgi:uncharacterized protein involved in high-affinity Fe2+ transport
MRIAPKALAAPALAALALATAACGSSGTDTSASLKRSDATITNPAAPARSGSMAGMKQGISTTGSGSMAGMKMGSPKTAGGIKAIPTQVLGSADWQNMKIKAQAMTAIPFIVYNGTREQTVKVPKHASFHLMVMLDDARTGYAIPYSTVWATVRKAGHVVYDERQWPMISEYMGPHYGNDVSLPGPGRYQLSLLISPPVSARHVEYKSVWLKPHRVSFTFNWKPAS